MADAFWKKRNGTSVKIRIVKRSQYFRIGYFMWLFTNRRERTELSIERLQAALARTDAHARYCNPVNSVHDAMETLSPPSPSPHLNVISILILIPLFIYSLFIY